IDHVFLRYNATCQVWDWVASIFGIKLVMRNVDSFLVFALNVYFSSQIKALWWLLFSQVFGLFVSLEREKIFDGVSCSFGSIIVKIKLTVLTSNKLDLEFSWGISSDNRILDVLIKSWCQVSKSASYFTCLVDSSYW
ncbi:hypothetical protein TorRG33x02_010620, partial [Trema orientale]